MRPFLFFFLLFITIIISTTEKENFNKTLNKTDNKHKNKTEKKSKKKSVDKSENKTEYKISEKTGNKTSNKTEKKRPKKKPKQKKRTPMSTPHHINFTSSLNLNDTENIVNKDIYSLNDLTFDMVLQKGNNHKWLVILYSQTCGHCEFARRELRKIFSNYKKNASIGFAEIEINRNPMTNMRFSIESVPYIFLLQNNSIYEMDLYPNQKNLIKFIDTNFEDVKNELKPFPPMVQLHKFGWIILQNIMHGITNGVNELLYEYGYEFEFTPLLLFLSVIIFFGSICLLEYFICLRFCPDKDVKKDNNNNKKKINEENKEEKEEEEENNENVIEEKDNKNDKRENKENNDKDITEKEKMVLENKKEIEKIKQNKQNKQKKESKEIKDKKLNKKKKKE